MLSAAVLAGLLDFLKRKPSKSHSNGGASSSTAGRCEIADRVDCSGHLHLGPQHHPPRISKAACLARGCCYDASAAASIAAQLTAAKTAKQRNRVPLSTSQCYYAAEGVALTHVHVINSNHFDAGYVSHVLRDPKEAGVKGERKRRPHAA